MRASKKFATLYDRAKEAELRLVVVLVPDSVSSDDLLQFTELGADPAGPDLDVALGKVEAFLALPSVQGLSEALAERKVILGQLDGLSRQAGETLADLRAVDASLAGLQQEAVVAGASIKSPSR